MKFAVDTDVLACAEGVNGTERHHAARQIIARLPPGEGHIPAPVLGELFAMLNRKAKRSAEASREAAMFWRDTYRVLSVTENAALLALDLVVAHGLSFAYAVVITTAADGGCRLLLSADLPQGFVWRGMTLVDPFAPIPHPLLVDALGPE